MCVTVQHGWWHACGWGCSMQQREATAHKWRIPREIEVDENLKRNLEMDRTLRQYLDMTDITEPGYVLCNISLGIKTPEVHLGKNI
jgi:hypothetical protein